MTTTEIKNEVLKNIETIRGMRHGFRVADLVFCGGAQPAAATAALKELVTEGVLVAMRSGRCLRYRAN